MARRLILIAYRDRQPLLRQIASQGLRFDIAQVITPDQIQSDLEFAWLNPEKLAKDQIWGIVIISDKGTRLPTALLLECQLNGVRVFDQYSFLEKAVRCIDLDAEDARWLSSLHQFSRYRVSLLWKRALDLFIATIGLILTLPLMLLVAFFIKCDSRGPALYRQERVGLRGRIFTLYKFRSMREDAEASGVPRWATVGDPRVTRVGKFIRYTRIDELPQLLNVLRGEMSLIGPRPERPYFVKQLAAAIPLYPTRHYIKPGITGWAQVNAPYGASLEEATEKLRYDLYYMKNRSLILDIWILLRTIRVILLREGAR